jgi:uncharacterized membrane protein YvbJ
MFCSECGKQVAGDAKFCGECGAAQSNAEQVISKATITSSAAPSSGNSNVAGYVVGAIWLVLLFSLYGKKEGSIEQPAERFEATAEAAPATEDTQIKESNKAYGICLGYHFIYFSDKKDEVKQAFSAMRKFEMDENVYNEAGKDFANSVLANVPLSEAASPSTSQNEYLVMARNECKKIGVNAL